MGVRFSFSLGWVWERWSSDRRERSWYCASRELVEKLCVCRWSFSSPACPLSSLSAEMAETRDWLREWLLMLMLSLL